MTLSCCSRAVNSTRFQKKIGENHEKQNRKERVCWKTASESSFPSGSASLKKDGTVQHSAVFDLALPHQKKTRTHAAHRDSHLAHSRTQHRKKHTHSHLFSLARWLSSFFQSIWRDCDFFIIFSIRDSRFPGDTQTSTFSSHSNFIPHLSPFTFTSPSTLRLYNLHQPAIISSGFFTVFSRSSNIDLTRS